ncbi:hypothetical protein LSTR_LSTR008612 [Laodelphax striatellus]|uniref:Thyrotropin-releasing hormone receptor n=1 Tax=Laodelphax striatellus TaxID=195883 RepID=A0A482X0B2_LAOST|nr:hypothetical protein LSTR_LSTR008612 [Laodelphax striatellus]
MDTSNESTDIYDVDYDYNRTFQTNCSYPLPYYYSFRYRLIGTVFQTIIFTSGCLGNIMVITIVSRCRTMRTPTNCYLTSLAVADIMVLVASVPLNIASYYVVSEQWLLPDITCSLVIYLQYLGINCSTLSLVAFTVERYIAICHPMKAHKMCTLHRAKRIILVTWLIAIVYCTPWFTTVGMRSINYRHFSIKKCDFLYNRDVYFRFYFTDLVVFYIFPLLLTCVLYGLIMRTLMRRSGGIGRCVRKNSVKAEIQSRMQVVKMLALVVALFAILWLPYRGLVVYNSLASIAINPILYNAMSTKFRNEFRKLLVCGGSEDTARHNLGSSRCHTASNISRTHVKVTDLEL